MKIELLSCKTVKLNHAIPSLEQLRHKWLDLSFPTFNPILFMSGKDGTTLFFSSNNSPFQYKLFFQEETQKLMQAGLDIFFYFTIIIRPGSPKPLAGSIMCSLNIVGRVTGPPPQSTWFWTPLGARPMPCCTGIYCVLSALLVGGVAVPKALKMRKFPKVGVPVRSDS